MLYGNAFERSFTEWSSKLTDADWKTLIRLYTFQQQTLCKNAKSDDLDFMYLQSKIDWARTQIGNPNYMAEQDIYKFILINQTYGTEKLLEDSNDLSEDEKVRIENEQMSWLSRLPEAKNMGKDNHNHNFN